MDTELIDNIIEDNLLRVGKYRGMFLSTHYLECFLLAKLCVRECLASDTPQIKKVYNSWEKARRSLHGDLCGPLVLADLPGTNPEIIARSLVEMASPIRCVRDSFKAIYSCVRSCSGDVHLDGSNNKIGVGGILCQFIEDSLESEKLVGLAPDQLEAFFRSLFGVWAELAMPNQCQHVLNDCSAKQIRLIGGNSLGIAWRCMEIHKSTHLLKRSVEDIAIADQQVLRWVRQQISE